MQGYVIEGLQCINCERLHMTTSTSTPIWANLEWHQIACIVCLIVEIDQMMVVFIVPPFQLDIMYFFIYNRNAQITFLNH